MKKFLKKTNKVLDSYLGFIKLGFEFLKLFIESIKD
jgi:hypothetical protein